MPILGEFYNSLNSDRLYSRLVSFKLSEYIELHMDPTYDYGCFVHRLILPQEIKLVKHY